MPCEKVEHDHNLSFGEYETAIHIGRINRFGEPCPLLSVADLALKYTLATDRVYNPLTTPPGYLKPIKTAIGNRCQSIVLLLGFPLL